MRKMVGNGFLNKSNMSMPSIESAFLSDLEIPRDEVIKKSIVIFHDESTFQANDEESWMWGEHELCVLKPKSHGSGIMVSDFIDEHNGYLRLTNEEFRQAAGRVDGLQREAHAFLEYGKEHEGYWTAKGNWRMPLKLQRLSIRKRMDIWSALFLITTVAMVC